MENDRTIVITGASSGVGLATALRLAKPGVNMVLIARRRPPLDDVAEQCRERGANALVLTGDMGKEHDVDEAARRVIATFGGFDVWINNASVAAYGSFLDIPSEEFSKVLRTNIDGYIYGARAALRHFSETEQGLLINVASALGAFPGPYISPYVTSKYAVRGLSAALRQELLYEKRRGIHVSTVLPATIDTPFYHHAANFSGKQLKAMDPVYPPEAVAAAIEKLITRPKAEVVVGAAARAPKLLYGVAPALAERIMARYVARLNYQQSPSANTNGNLFESENYSAQTSGGWSRTGSRMWQVALGAGTLLAAIGLMKKHHNHKERKHDKR